MCPCKGRGYCPDGQHRRLELTAPMAPPTQSPHSEEGGPRNPGRVGVSVISTCVPSTRVGGQPPVLLIPSAGPSPGRMGPGQFINNCKLPTAGRGAGGPLPECIQGMDKAKPSGSHARPLVFAISHPKDSRGQGLALGTSQRLSALARGQCRPDAQTPTQRAGACCPAAPLPGTRAAEGTAAT